MFKIEKILLERRYKYKQKLNYVQNWDKVIKYNVNIVSIIMNNIYVFCMIVGSNSIDAQK